MKTKFYWVALLASAALIAQAKAGGHAGGGGGGFAGGGHAASGGGGARASSFSPHGNFGGARFMAPGRFGPYGLRSSPGLSRQHVVASQRGFADRAQIATGAMGNRDDRFRSARNLRSGGDARNHLFARRPADWHRDWDRHRDHFWNGHRCRFVNGQWLIFDFGFDPYDYWYPWPYPYGPYSDDYYQYDYYPGGYDGNDGDYYDQGANNSSNGEAASIVAAAQGQLAQQGYYRGEIDGGFGSETRRAITRYQRDHRLAITGLLNIDTMRALGLRTVASN